MLFVVDLADNRVRQISFNPVTEPVLPANLRLGTFAGLEIVGTIGRTYEIQASPDMANWAPKAKVLLTTNPQLWIDQNPVSGTKYYRAFLLP
jgi:hypothetical protein